MLYDTNTSSKYKEEALMSFRSINPVTSFNGPNHPHYRRQFFWVNEGEHYSTALFAGKEVIARMNSDGSTYGLTYLDMKHPLDFPSLDEAKLAAHDFTKAVLVHMIKKIGFSEEDKNDPALSRL